MRPRSLVAHHRAAGLVAALALAALALAALALAALALPASVMAQSTGADSSLAPGSRVRIVVARDSKRHAAYVGTLIDATDRSVVLRPDRSRDTVELARDSISRTQVSRGHDRGRSAVKGFAIGAAAGAVLGFLVGDDCSDNNDFICFSRSETVPLGALAIGGAGLLSGLIFSRERWVEASMPSSRSAPRVSLTPLRSGGVAMRAELGF